MWPNSIDTQALVLRAKQGDAAATNELLERHREAIRRLVHMRLDVDLQRRVDASDIVQEVLIDAHRRLTGYLERPEMPFHLWLRHMARDKIIDAHRRHRGAARRSIDREQLLDGGFDASESALDLAARLNDHRELTPAAAATRQELERRFRQAVERLDETDREVILMRHVEQLSNQEVAQALELSEPAAGMRYMRAMRRLRVLLADPPSKAGPDA